MSQTKTATVENKHIIVKFGGDNFSNILKEVKKIQGRRFDPQKRVWSVPRNEESTKTLLRLGFSMTGIDDTTKKVVFFSPEPPKKQIDLSLLDPRTFKYQIEGIQFLEATEGNGGLGDPMGLGKGMLHGTPVYTMNGWKNIEDLKTTDKVIGSDGVFYKVKGVYYRGVLPVFKVSFNDGTSLIVDDDHLWQVDHVRNGWKAPKVKETRELRKNVSDKWGNNNWRIPLVKPIPFVQKEQSIPPYFLGVLIGDGSFCSNSVTIGNPDYPIIEKCSLDVSTTDIVIKRMGCSDPYRCPSYIIKNVTPALRAISLYGRRSHEKFIPESYLYGSIEQRIEILRGLMDTDGDCREDGTTQFCTTSEQLAKDVIFIVQSLGGVARISGKDPHFTYKGEVRQGKHAYILTLSIPINPFFLKRKADRWSPRKKYQSTRIIKSIESCGEGEVTCIIVDSPDKLFVAGENLIVTHNTNILIQYLMLHPEIRPVLVVVPASIKTKWQREVWEWGKEQSWIWPDNRQNKKGIFIINYEQLVKYEETEEQKEMRLFRAKLKKAKYTRKESNIEMHRQFPHPDPKPMGDLSMYGFKMIVADEVQYISGESTLRARFFIQIAKNVPKFVPISGTPIRSKPVEFFNVLNLLAPEVFPNRWQYQMKFCGAYRSRFGWNFKGVSNLDELHEKTKSLFIRHNKEEAWKEMPPKRKMIIPLDLDDVLGDEYFHADDEFMEWVVSSQRKLFETRNRLAVLRQLAYQAKRDSLLTYIQDWLNQNEGEKKVIFAYHKKTMDDLMKQFGDVSVRIDGSTPVKARQDIVDQFQNDKKTRLFIGQIHAAGVGIDLTAANSLAFVEMWWVPADMEQCSDRLQRRGQLASHIDIEYLVAANTIEDDMALALIDKYKVVTKILDGINDAEFFDEDFLEIVLKERMKNRKENE